MYSADYNYDGIQIKTDYHPDSPSGIDRHWLAQTADGQYESRGNSEAHALNNLLNWLRACGVVTNV